MRRSRTRPAALCSCPLARVARHQLSQLLALLKSLYGSAGPPRSHPWSARTTCVVVGGDPRRNSAARRHLRKRRSQCRSSRIRNSGSGRSRRLALARDENQQRRRRRRTATSSRRCRSRPGPGPAARHATAERDRRSVRRSSNERRGVVVLARPRRRCAQQTVVAARLDDRARRSNSQRIRRRAVAPAQLRAPAAHDKTAPFHAKGHSSPWRQSVARARAAGSARARWGGRFARAGGPRPSPARSHPLAHILGGSDRQRASRAGTTDSTPRVGAGPVTTVLT
jgi:hypothetical protein